jgi:hypothetical protein
MYLGSHFPASLLLLLSPLLVIDTFVEYAGSFRTVVLARNRYYFKFQRVPPPSSPCLKQPISPNVSSFVTEINARANR